jgi:hypothetical protein
MVSVFWCVPGSCLNSLSSIVLPLASPRLFPYAQLIRFVLYNFELAAPNPNPRIHNVDRHHRAIAYGDYPERPLSYPAVSAISAFTAASAKEDGDPYGGLKSLQQLMEFIEM